MIEKGSESAVTSENLLARAGSKGNQARTRGPSQPPDAISHQRAVLWRELHHVREGAQGSNVGVGAPDIRPPQALSQRSQELERHARTRKVARGPLCSELGVRHGNSLGNKVRRLVVIGHNHVYALLAEPVDLMLRSNAVVDGHEEVRLAVCQHAVERGLGKAVALAKAVGDVGTGAAAQLAQAQREDAGGAHAVDVEVAKDGNVLPRPHGALDAVCRLGHPGDEERVCPVALERGSEECACLLGAGEATGHEDPCH